MCHWMWSEKKWNKKEKSNFHQNLLVKKYLTSYFHIFEFSIVFFADIFISIFLFDFVYLLFTPFSYTQITTFLRILFIRCLHGIRKMKIFNNSYRLESQCAIFALLLPARDVGIFQNRFVHFMFAIVYIWLRFFNICTE